MHAENSSYPVEIEIQGKCNISCRLFQVVYVLHEAKEGPKEIVQFSMINPSLIGENSSKKNTRK